MKTNRVAVGCKKQIKVFFKQIKIYNYLSIKKILVFLQPKIKSN